MNDDLFSDFERFDLPYARINGTELLATVLIPKTLVKPSPLSSLPAQGYPVLVHWHGGGFVAGHRMFAPWWPRWQVAYLLQLSIIA